MDQGSRKMKKKYMILIVFIVLLCSCGRKVSTEGSNLIDLDDKVYAEEDLQKIVNFNGSLTELNAQYSIKCKREINQQYRAAFRGETKIAILYFDKDGNKVFSKAYQWSVKKECFDKLQKGDSLDKVIQIDPDGEYLFLYTDRNDFHSSVHFTTDGYLITIDYDEKNTIKSIDIELI